MIQTIISLIEEVIEIKKKRKETQTVQYKCEHYETSDDDYFYYQKQYEEKIEELRRTINEFLGISSYGKILFIKYKTGAYIEEKPYSEIIHIPKTKSKQYYCLLTEMNKRKDILQKIESNMYERYLIKWWRL